jgi:hypothetical protein
MLMKRCSMLCVLVVILGLCASAAARETPDYSDPARWLALPSYTATDTDVFYLYPTACGAKVHTICGAEDPCMREGAQAHFERQIPLFEDMGDVYAPYYSQAAGYANQEASPAERRKLASGAPGRDVFAAFEYYMEHYNLDRPFIFVGASQGAEILLHLLSGYMAENSSLFRKMRAAYLIDCAISDEYLRANPHLRFARTSDGDGIIISWSGSLSGVPQEPLKRQ